MGASQEEEGWQLHITSQKYARGNYSNPGHKLGTQREVLEVGVGREEEQKRSFCPIYPTVQNGKGRRRDDSIVSTFP
jgi:hypothetical protein